MSIKKISVCCVVSLLVLTFNVKADVVFPVDPPSTEDPIEDPYSHRHRMPPASIMCTIDFEAKTVVFTSSTIEGIIDYQVYEEDGEMCVGSYGNAADFVEALSSLSGDYCIRFITPTGNLTGYINLNI